jgi:adenylate kinase
VRSVLVTGVQGVGKSTVSRLAAHALGLENWDYADLMLRVAPDLQDKDAIRNLSWQKRCQIYMKTLTRCSQRFSCQATVATRVFYSKTT